MKKTLAFLPLLAAAVLAGVFTACGDVPIKKNLPDYVLKVAIPVFENKASQPGLENELTKKVVQNFIVDGRLQVVPREQADALLTATIQRYDRLVITRDANQVPQQYKLQVVVDLDLVDLKSGKQDQLWSTRPQFSLTPGVEVTKDDFDSTNTRSLREATNYYVLNVAGVPPEDEPTALERLLEQMARRVVRRTLDGF
jgi:hypothetical protein